MIMSTAARTAEPIGPAGFLQCGPTLLLGAVEPLEPNEGEALLELDRTADLGQTGICVQVWP